MRSPLGTLVLSFWMALGFVVEPCRSDDAGPRTDRHGDALPPFAVARLGTVRWRSLVPDGGGPTVLAFSPDGQVLASIGDSGWLCLRDVSKGQLVSWLSRVPNARAVAFSADGKTLTTEADRPLDRAPADPPRFKRTIQRWESGTGRLISTVTVEQFQNSREFSVFSPAGGILVGHDGDDKVRVRDAATGKPLFEVDREVNHGKGLGFSADGSRLVWVGKDAKPQLIDTATGKELRRFQVTRDGKPSVSFVLPTLSPDGKTVVASGDEALCVWDATSGELRREVEGMGGRSAFSPDGKFLACVNADGLRVWEAATFKEVCRVKGPLGEPRSLAFSPDGKTLATGHEHFLALWEVATGKMLDSSEGHEGAVTSLTFTPDGKGLASGATDGKAIVWDLATSRSRHYLAGHYHTAGALAFSPDGKVLATGDGDPTGMYSREAAVRLWDLDDGKLLRQFVGHFNSVHALAFSPDGKRLATGGWDARVRVWDPQAGRRLYHVRGAEGRKNVAFGADGEAVLIAGWGSELALWRSEDGEFLRSFGPRHDEDRGVRGGNVLAERQLIWSVEDQADSSRPTCLIFWDAATGQEVRKVTLEQTRGFSGAVHALSPDGKLLATASDWNESMQRGAKAILWDTESGTVVARLRGHAGPIQSLAFSPDGRLLASGSHDTTVLVWEAATARLQVLWEALAGRPELPSPVRRAAEDPKRAAEFLKDRLARAAAADAQARKWIPALDDDDFTVREKATQELERLGPEVEYPARLALDRDPSPEVRERLNNLLRKHQDRTPAERSNPPRMQAALMLLEKMDGAEARQTLEELARGPAGSAITLEANAALKRLGQGPKP